MPITICGNNFQSEWDLRERSRIVLYIQTAMVDRRLLIDDVMTLFAEQDQSCSGTLMFVE